MDKNLLNFLKELKKYGIRKNIPNISEKKGKFLNLLLKISHSKNILEIGCANGYSTIWLAEAVKQNKGKIVTIDFSLPSFRAAKKNLAKTGFSKITDLLFGNAVDIIPKINRKFDFVFVDGEKRSYEKFWELIKKKLEKSSLVIFDDIISYPAKTAEFLKKIKKLKGFDTMVMQIDKNDEILIIYK